MRPKESFFFMPDSNPVVTGKDQVIQCDKKKSNCDVASGQTLKPTLHVRPSYSLELLRQIRKGKDHHHNDCSELEEITQAIQYGRCRSTRVRTHR